MYANVISTLGVFWDGGLIPAQEPSGAYYRLVAR